MENRVALIGIVVENLDATEKINELLHQYAARIVGPMGIPYHKRDVCILSVVLDAPQSEISALSGKLGRLPGVNTKTGYAKVTEETP